VTIVVNNAIELTMKSQPGFMRGYILTTHSGDQVARWLKWLKWLRWLKWLKWLRWLGGSGDFQPDPPDPLGHGVPRSSDAKGLIPPGPSLLGADRPCSSNSGLHTRRCRD
jgi:hypothetical protein